MQINPLNKGLIHTARTLYASEGLKAFYLSYPVTLTMSVPFQMIQFTTYEYANKELNPKGTYSPLVHCVSGAVAGASASFLTHPLDVAKTALQTRGLSKDADLRNASGLRHTFQLIYKKHGLVGFTRGVGARLLAHIPSTAVSWTTVLKLLTLVRVP